MKRILFVCTGNTCRSSMAEALFKYLLLNEKLHKDYVVSSAGTSAYMTLPASDNAIEALREMEIDLKAHKSRMLTEEMIKEADIILTMTRSHKGQVLKIAPEAASKVYTLKEYVGSSGDVADPFGGSLEIYRQCRDEIAHNLKKVIDKIKQEGN